MHHTQNDPDDKDTFFLLVFLHRRINNAYLNYIQLQKLCISGAS